jgi:hypothetical protein
MWDFKPGSLVTRLVGFSEKENRVLRRYYIGFLTVVLAFTLVACGGGSTVTDDTAPDGVPAVETPAAEE